MMAEISQLPDELLELVLIFLPFPDIIKISNSNSRFHKVCSREEFWHRIAERDYVAIFPGLPQYLTRKKWRELTYYLSRRRIIPLVKGEKIVHHIIISPDDDIYQLHTALTTFPSLEKLSVIELKYIPYCYTGKWIGATLSMGNIHTQIYPVNMISSGLTKRFYSENNRQDKDYYPIGNKSIYFTVDGRKLNDITVNELFITTHDIYSGLRVVHPLQMDCKYTLFNSLHHFYYKLPNS